MGSILSAYQAFDLLKAPTGADQNSLIIIRV